MGLFVPVKAFEDASDVAGIYDGAGPVAAGSHDMPVSQQLILNADGTFQWEGVSFSKSNPGSSGITVSSGATTTGRWDLAGLSLALTSSTNVSLRRIAFPLDEEKTIIRPDRIYFGGLVFKR